MKTIYIILKFDGSFHDIKLTLEDTQECIEKLELKLALDGESVTKAYYITKDIKL